MSKSGIDSVLLSGNLTMGQVGSMFQRLILETKDPQATENVGRKYGRVVSYSEENGASNPNLRNAIQNFVDGAEKIPEGARVDLDTRVGDNITLLLIRSNNVQNLGQENEMATDNDLSTHWTTLNLRKNNNGEIEILYADSIGSHDGKDKIPEAAKKILQECGIDPVISQKDFISIQQTDANCGYMAVWHALKMHWVEVFTNHNEFIETQRGFLLSQEEQATDQNQKKFLYSEESGLLKKEEKIKNDLKNIPEIRTHKIKNKDESNLVIELQQSYQTYQMREKLDPLLESIEKLGHFYHKRALSGESTVDQRGEDFVSASMFYNASLAIRRSNKEDVDKKSNIKNFLENIERDFVLEIIKKEKYLPSLSWLEDDHISYKSDILKIRESAHKNLREIRTKEEFGCELNQILKRAEKIRKLSSHINDEIKSFIVERIKEVIDICGEPPCEYSFILLGSLSKGTATPYSDLEFGIIIEDRNEVEQNFRNKQYFRNVARLLNLRILNLGESMIPESDYGIRLNELFKMGIMFDLGGKTPLNRKRDHTIIIDGKELYPAGSNKYDLIATPEELLGYFDPKYLEIDTYLSFELENATLLLHNENVESEKNNTYKQYRYKLNEYLHKNSSFAIERIKKVLHQGIIPIHKEDLYNKKLIIPDIQKYDNAVRSRKQIMANYSVKNDIYRLPDRLIEGVARIFGIYDKHNSFDLLSSLHEGSYINDEQKNCLIAMTGISIEMNLLYVLSNGGQGGELGVWDVDKQLLTSYYKFAMPFHKAVKDFCDKGFNKEDLYHNSFIDDSDKINAMIKFRLGELQEANDYFRSYFSINNKEQSYFNIEKNGDDLEAIAVYADLINLQRGYRSLEDMSTFIGVGNIYFSSDRFDTAKQGFENLSERCGYLSSSIIKKILCHNKAVYLFQEDLNESDCIKTIERSEKYIYCGSYTIILTEKDRIRLGMNDAICFGDVKRVQRYLSDTSFNEGNILDAMNDLLEYKYKCSLPGKGSLIKDETFIFIFSELAKKIQCKPIIGFDLLDKINGGIKNSLGDNKIFYQNCLNIVDFYKCKSEQKHSKEESNINEVSTLSSPILEPSTTLQKPYLKQFSKKSEQNLTT